MGAVSAKVIHCSRHTREAGNPVGGQKGRGSGGRNFSTRPKSEVTPYRHNIGRIAAKFIFLPLYVISYIWK